MTYWKNIYLGSVELVMAYGGGAFHVYDEGAPDKAHRSASYGEVFTGTFEECLEYMTKREQEYLREMY